MVFFVILAGRHRRCCLLPGYRVVFLTPGGWSKMSAEGRGQENVGRGWRRSHNQGQLEREEASFQRSKENFTNSKMDKIFDKFKSKLLREKKKGLHFFPLEI